MHDVILLMLIGLVAGAAGGLLGIGGSIVMIPAMTLVLGPDQHLYQAAAMIVNFFVVVPAVVQHHRAGAIDARAVSRIIPPALVAVLVGVGLSELDIFAGDNEVYLRAAFGLFLAYVVVQDLVQLAMRSNRAGQAGTPLDGRPREIRWSAALGVSLPTGLVAGLLGVGGGVVAVPLQRRLLGLPMRQAIANSAVIIIATSICGAVVKNYAFALDTGRAAAPLQLAMLLIPTAMIGSMIGARLTHRLPVPIVRAAFDVILIAAAFRMITGSLGEP